MSNVIFVTGWTAWKSTDWNNVAQDRDKWWAHVNTIMNLQVP
jgi:hypothetical protein